MWRESKGDQGHGFSKRGIRGIRRRKARRIGDSGRFGTKILERLKVGVEGKIESEKGNTEGRREIAESRRKTRSGDRTTRGNRRTFEVQNARRRRCEDGSRGSKVGDKRRRILTRLKW